MSIHCSCRINKDLRTAMVVIGRKSCDEKRNKSRRCGRTASKEKLECFTNCQPYICRKDSGASVMRRGKAIQVPAASG